MGVALEGPRAVVLRPDDTVAVAARPLPRGFLLESGGRPVEIREPIGLGHKVALADIAPGEPVRKYGQIIGFASKAIPAGSLVHVHNLKADLFERDYAFATETPAPAAAGGAKDLSRLPPARRPGRHAELHRGDQHRQLLGEHVAIRRRSIPRQPLAQGLSQRRRRLRHHAQRGLRSARSKGRTTTSSSGCWPGFANHPNVAAYVIVGPGLRSQLRTAPGRRAGPGHARAGEAATVIRSRARGRGCSTSRRKEASRGRSKRPCARFTTCCPRPIRGSGPSSRRRRSAWPWSAAVPTATRASRPTRRWASRPTCWSRREASAVLGETTEIYGAEHLLTRRAVSREVGQKLVDRIKWWEWYTGIFGAQIDNNPSPGNKAGGLTTIYEKSLGALAKAGSTALVDVVPYAAQGRRPRADLHGHARLRPTVHDRARSPAGPMCWSSRRAAAACWG